MARDGVIESWNRLIYPWRIMWRALVLFLVLVPASAYAQVYRWVDVEGQTHYSDRPWPGSDRVQVETEPGADTTGSEGVESSVLAKLGPYTSLEIVAPKANQTLRQDPESLSVSLLVDPPLLPGHRLELLIDGVPITSKGPIGTQLNLSGLSLGSHVAQAQVLDAAGIVATSVPVNFHLRQPLPPGVLP